MKKTLIAVAALAATSAFAQNVTVSGTMDATFRMNNIELADGTSYDTTKLGKDGIGTTGFVLSGNEDLGGGLKAVFLYEQNFDLSDTGAAQANGQQFVGLEGAFGSVKLGTPNTPTLTVQGARGAGFGTKDGGRLSIMGGTLMGESLTRFDSTILYTSPKFSGFNFAVNYQPGSDSTSTTVDKEGAMTDIGLFYGNGPLAAGVAIYNQAEDTLGGTVVDAEVKQTSYYVSYAFSFAKFTLGGHTYEKGTAENSGYNLAADVPLSAKLTLTANLQQLDDKSAADVDRTSTALGLQYAMSNRTVAYARYIQGKADNTTGTAVKDASSMLVGLRHNF